MTNWLSCFAPIGLERVVGEVSPSQKLMSILKYYCQRKFVVNICNLEHWSWPGGLFLKGFKEPNHQPRSHEFLLIQNLLPRKFLSRTTRPWLSTQSDLVSYTSVRYIPLTLLLYYYCSYCNVKFLTILVLILIKFIFVIWV